MLHRLRLALPALLLAAAASAPAVAAELKIALAGDNPPFAAMQAGEVSGFNAEMARALCAEMQATCTLLPLTENDLLAALKDGRADAALALPVQKDVGDGVLFSQRYYKQGARFARKKGDKAKIAYKRMAGKNVSVVRNSIYDTFLSKKFPGVNIKRYDNQKDAAAALLQGEVEYMLGGRAAQHAWAAEQENFEVAGPNYSTAKYFADMVIAVRTPALQQQFNSALQALRESGVYQEINKKYFPFDLYGR